MCNYLYLFAAHTYRPYWSRGVQVSVSIKRVMPHGTSMSHRNTSNECNVVWIVRCTSGCHRPNRLLLDVPTILPCDTDGTSHLTRLALGKQKVLAVYAAPNFQEGIRSKCTPMCSRYFRTQNATQITIRIALIASLAFQKVVCVILTKSRPARFQGCIRSKVTLPE